MTDSPWLVVVMLGAAIAGFAWLMPKSSAKDRGGSEAIDEAAYERLLEDLEAENRELVDAVEKFKREQDETVYRLTVRIRDMEEQMKAWSSGRGGAPAQERAPEATAAMAAATLAEAGARAAATAAEAGSPAAVEAAAGSAADVAGARPELAEDAKAGPAEAPELPVTSIRGRYAELLAMHDAGRSVDQIAKAAGMNKGEVQLILQLARREAEHHA